MELSVKQLKLIREALDISEALHHKAYADMAVSFMVAGGIHPEKYDKMPIDGTLTVLKMNDIKQLKEQVKILLDKELEKMEG